MKKTILAVSIIIFAGGVASFALLRANRTIHQQQRALSEISAKADRLERAASSRSSSAGDNLFPLSRDNFVENAALTSESTGDLKAEVSELRQSVARLQDELDALRKSAELGALRKRADLAPINRNAIGANVPFGGATNAFIFRNPNATPQVPQAPKGGIPFEFNGDTYYRVPLALAK